MPNKFSDATKPMANPAVPIAQLSVISLAKLSRNDSTEVALINKVASSTGFFYLDLHRDAVGECVLRHLPKVFSMTEKYFTQPNGIKMNDIRVDIKASQDLGYKRARCDCESFEISRDEIESRGGSTTHVPHMFQGVWKEVTTFSGGCDKACLTMLNSLSSDYMRHHRIDEPSNSGLKLVLHPSSAKLSDVGETLHTDSGTLTLLFYIDWSIHAFLPDANIWAFIAPPPEGCALVNVANSLQRLSRGKLHSPKHRVTQIYDGAKNRYYLSYYLRPETSLVEEWEAAD